MDNNQRRIRTTKIYAEVNKLIKARVQTTEGFISRPTIIKGYRSAMNESEFGKQIYNMCVDVCEDNTSIAAAAREVNELCTDAEIEWLVDYLCAQMEKGQKEEEMRLAKEAEAKAEAVSHVQAKEEVAAVSSDPEVLETVEEAKVVESSTNEQDTVNFNGSPSNEGAMFGNETADEFFNRILHEAEEQGFEEYANTAEEETSHFKEFFEYSRKSLFGGETWKALVRLLDMDPVDAYYKAIHLFDVARFEILRKGACDKMKSIRFITRLKEKIVALRMKMANSIPVLLGGLFNKIARVIGNGLHYFINALAVVGKIIAGGMTAIVLGAVRFGYKSFYNVKLHSLNCIDAVKRNLEFYNGWKGKTLSCLTSIGSAIVMLFVTELYLLCSELHGLGKAIMITYRDIMDNSRKATGATV